MNTAARRTCPVINCGRAYDNASLLDGHLKRYTSLSSSAASHFSFVFFLNPNVAAKHLICRFDHSPCDPTIHLKGCPAELFACPACALHFETKEKWRRHLEFKVAAHPSLQIINSVRVRKETHVKWSYSHKVSSSSPDGHSATLRYQRIVCFACPACYLFFNLRDECLQHMSAKNHFTVSLPMAGQV